MKTFQKRAFLLVFALILTTLIALIALALLGIRKGGYASSQAVVNSVQARCLARSGMGDIWTKLSKDPLFPPGAGDAQVLFSYREEVKDASDKVIGAYRVTMDRSDRYETEVIRVESTGVAGALADESSHFTIYGELSIKPGDFRFKVWQEGTSPKL